MELDFSVTWIWIIESVGRDLQECLPDSQDPAGGLVGFRMLP